MAGSFTAQEIARALINGNLTGAELETLVTSGTMASTYLGACRDLFTSGTMNAILNSQVGFTSLVGSATLLPYLLNFRGVDIAASDNATAWITTVPAAMVAIVDSTTFLDLWISVAENRTRLSNRANASGSVLVRQQFTENGTYTVPAGGLLRLSYFVIGPGGNGGSTPNGSYKGTGGSGGGASFGTVPPGSIPAAGENIIITVPTSAGSDATIGAFATGASGANGISITTSAQNVPGGGFTSGSSCYDTDVTTAVYQPNTGTKAGGMGGGVISNTIGSNGTAGLTGSGGIAGGTGGGAGGGTAGTGYGSGGGAGQHNPSSSYANGQSAAATDYGCGGGGAAGAGVIAGTGGTGAGGLAIIYGVKAVA